MSWGRKGSSDIRVKQLLGDSRKETQRVSKKRSKEVSENFALHDLLDKAGKSNGQAALQ